jgi:hypothetical protein
VTAPRRLLAVVLAAGLLAACSGDGGATKQSTATSGNDGSASSEGSGKSKRQDRVPCPAARTVEVARPGISFTDVTQASGLIAPLLGMYGHAVAVGDVNGDSWPDLFVGTFADKKNARYRFRGAEGPSPDRLLLGGARGFRQAGTFPDQLGRTSGAVFADLDTDGDADLVVTRNITKARPDGAPTAVYRNDGGRFSVATPLVNGRGARGIGVLDFDADGVLDLFVSVDPFAGGQSALLRGLGGLRYEDVTSGAGLPADLPGYGVSTADLTGDGRPDLFVAGANRLFVNAGGGRFEPAASDVFHWDVHGSEDVVTGVAVGDVDADGRPDLVLGHHYNSTVDKGCRIATRLYLNRGGARFEDVTEKAGLPPLPTKGPDVELVDFDNDSRLDLLVTASVDAGKQPVVLRNTGVQDGVPRFVGGEGLGDKQYWVTAVTADFDHDGRLDVFLVENDPAKPSLLLRNTTSGGKWLEVVVAPGGFGALVELYRPGGLGQAAQLLRRQQVLVERGFAAGGLPLVHVGLGNLDSVDVRVRLPGESTWIERRAVPADQRLCVPVSCASG